MPQRRNTRPHFIAKLRRLVVAAPPLLGVLAAHPAAAIVFQNTAAQTAGLGAGQSFLNGEAELIIALSNDTEVGCSGSLLAGGAYILTAAHCVTGDTDTASATSISVNFANVGLVTTGASYIVDPTWNGSVTNGGDLALITLATPVTTIAGYQVDTSSSALGDVVTLAGYGLTGVGSTGYAGNTFGTLYYGANQYDAVYSTIPSVYAYDFDQYGTNADNVIGAGAVGTNEAMIAPGDSGGASLIDVNGTWEIVGVHDFITCITPDCTPDSSFGQLGGDTSVYADAGFLDPFLVPEPASVAVLGIAMAGLLAMARRRPAAPSRQTSDIEVASRTRRP